jgi:3-oxoadipate enol-lactonase
MKVQPGLPLYSSINAAVEHKELNQNGYTIHYFVSGEAGRELLIFLHPAFADHRCFDEQIDFFASKYRIVTIDLLGHGLSKVNKAKDKIDASALHIHSIVQAEGYVKAHVVGVSLGSLIAQYFALRFPTAIASLVSLGGYSIQGDNREILAAQRFENIKWILMAVFSMNAFRRYVAKVSLSKPEGQTRFYQMALLFTRRSFSAMSGLRHVLQKRSQVRRQYPLLIMSGERDLPLSLRMGRKWHDSEPQSQYFIMKDAGHCANMDCPEAFNKLLLDFINSIHDSQQVAGKLVT